MECTLEDIYDANGCYLLICKVANTYVREELLQEDGKKIDYSRFRPVLFEQQGFRYVSTGDPIGPCVAPGKAYAESLK